MKNKIWAENGSAGQPAAPQDHPPEEILNGRLDLQPARLLIITVVAAFLAEVIAMVIIAFLGNWDYVWLVLVDALILVIIIFPVLYFFSFRPLLELLNQRQQALVALRRLQLELEQRVQQRTADLNQANQSLSLEIAERVQAEEQLRYQATLLENVYDAIIASDENYRLTAWNAAAESMYGWRADEVLGRNGVEILQTDFLTADPQEMRRTIDELGWWRGEATQRRKDGVRIPVEVSSIVLRHGNGTVRGYVSVNRDITARKQAEDQIRMLARFPEENPNPVMRVDFEGRLLYANPASNCLLQWWNCRLGDRLPAVWSQAALQALETGRSHETEIACEHRIYIMSFNPILDCGYVNLYGRDITDRKKAEEALQLSEERFSKAFRSSPAAISITRLSDGKFVDVNDSFLKIFGYTRAELFDLSSVILYADPNARAQLVQNLLEQKAVRDQEMAARAKTGETLHVLLSSEIIVLDGEAHMLTILYDITERKRIEQAILLAKQEWERTFDAVPDLVAILDEQQNIVRLNRAMAERLGRTPQECIGLKCYQAVHGTPCAPAFCPHVLTRQDGQTHSADIHEPHLGGDFLVSTTPILDAQNRLVASVHVARDITEHKRAERALQQARDELELRVQQRTLELAQANQVLDQTNKLLERYFSSIDTLIAYMDRDFNFIRVNEAYAKSAGFPVEYFQGKNHFALYPHAENQAIFQRVVDTGEPYSVFEKAFEYPNQPERGVTYWDWSLQPVKKPDGLVEGVVLSLVDVTGRKRAEEELARQNQELLALSRREHEHREFAESLAQSAISLNSSLELEQVLGNILEQIQRAVPFSAADIILKEGRTFRVVGFLNHRDGDGAWPPADSVRSLDDFPLLEQIFSTRQPLLIAEVDGTADWQQRVGLDWVRSYIGAPLVTAGQVSGIINLLSENPRAFDQAALERLMAYTAPAAAAMQNAWLFDQVRSSNARLQALSRRLVEVQEGERRYIASELHDEVGQALTGLTLALQLIEKNAGNPPRVLQEVEQMYQLLENIMEDLHRLAVDLRPASLDHLGLAAALQQHVAMVSEKFGLVARFQMLGLQGRLPEEMEIAFYRIVQEALNNVVRHSKAKCVDVILEPRQDSLVLIIEDDGVGFDPQSISSKPGRLGLFGMRERAEMLGGKLIIESCVGNGTTLVVEVPYGNSHSDRR